jgi:hypothetical protein
LSILKDRKKKIAEILSSNFLLVLMAIFNVENLEIELSQKTNVGNELLLC